MWAGFRPAHWSTYMYDPTSMRDRRELADHLLMVLDSHGFEHQPMLTASELIYRKLEGRLAVTRVYTSIVGYLVRESGDDAIRILTQREDNIIYRSTIHRKGSLGSITQRLAYRMIAAHEIVMNPLTCPDCNGELSMSKKGDRYCKPCWLAKR